MPPPGEPTADADTAGLGAAAVDAPAAPGPARAGRYELLAVIARGGMGVVYRARDTLLDRDVAVKLLHDRFPADSAAARRFAEEARITGQLQHPAIPPLHDLGTLPDGRPFLAMKLIRGRTLDELLGERPDPAHDRGRFLAAFEQVCQAVGYAHAHNVLHRDLKPSNVMVGFFGEVQVMDWGLAKVLAGRASRDPGPAGGETTGAVTEIRSDRDEGSETRAGSVLGTPAYMPPEQAIGAVDQIDERSDVFGLGAILCAILTGRPPFVGDTPESARQLAARAKLDDTRARLDGCGADPELVALAKRCLAADPADRPRDAGEVAAAVAGLREAADERARRAELDRVRAEGERAKAEAEAREQHKRRRAQLALAAAVGLLLLGGGAAGWWADRQAAARRGQLARNADALADLVGRCEQALRDGDAGRAAAALDEIDRRLAEGGGEAFTRRADRCRADLAVLRDLDAIDTFRWTPAGGDSGKYPGGKDLAARWRVAFAGYGVVAGETSAGEAAGRVNGSLVRDRLLAALDLWLVLDSSPGVRDVIGAADPDPYRGAVRDAVAAGDAARAAELAGRPEALAQPPGFAAAVGRIRGVPVERKRAVLEAALRPRPGDLALLMELGGTYPVDRREGADERVRWLQAAVATHPRNVAAYNNLGNALRDKGDLDGAITAFREAIRLDPSNAVVHNNLAAALYRKKDLDGAIGYFREATRLDPGYAVAHYNLGIVLRAKGDLDGALAAYREAIRLDPGGARAHYNLGIALAVKGDVDGAAAAFEEAARLDPESADAHYNLGVILSRKGDLDGAIGCYRRALRVNPDHAGARNNLVLALELKAERDAGVAPPPREVKRR
jgi:tetratricopeptide (TPR) repeat protein